VGFRDTSCESMNKCSLKRSGFSAAKDARGWRIACGGRSAGVREECRRVKRVLERVEVEVREMTVWKSW
jgi:hypothetical protein